jgi:uncharacterized protein YyaL (SSP411 family)
MLYAEEAQRILCANAEHMRNAGFEMAHWFDAAMELIGPFYVVALIGPQDHPAYAQMLQAFHRKFPRHALLVQVHGTEPTEEQRRNLPCLEGKIAKDGRPTAWVCSLGSCAEPVFDADELVAQFMKGWER